MPVQILGCDIVREADGSATTRNLLLSPDARRLAGPSMASSVAARTPRLLRDSLERVLMSPVQTVHGRCAAVVVGEGDQAVRLIDNMAVSAANDQTMVRDADFSSRCR